MKEEAEAEEDKDSEGLEEPLKEVLVRPPSCMVGEHDTEEAGDDLLQVVVVGALEKLDKLEEVVEELACWLLVGELDDLEEEAEDVEDEELTEERLRPLIVLFWPSDAGDELCWNAVATNGPERPAGLGMSSLGLEASLC